MDGKVRMGMIGGGIGAFIGSVHRMAAALDDRMELVCGAFSSDPEKSKLSGKELFLNPERVYGSWQEMIEKESRLPEDVRMEVVSIVTPNHMHFAPARLALEAGFHVISDKPLTFDLQEAYALRDIVAKSGKIFALTHNYAAYPMVKQARHMVSTGTLGMIRKVVAEYPQGWLSSLLEASDNKQASWRTDPSRSGIAGSVGDIGTHAENLLHYITGLNITELCADVHTLVEGRKLDDDANVLLGFSNGARGILYASQISAGEENNLRIRVYGEHGSIEWAQMEPNSLIVRWLDKPIQIYRTGGPDVCSASMACTRLPSGHPEGYIEAFATIYRNVAMCIQAARSGKRAEAHYYDFPGIDDGVRGMEFICKVIESGKSNQKWIQWNT